MRHRTLLVPAGALAAFALSASATAAMVAAPAEGEEVELHVWAQAGATEFWRADGPALAAEDVETWQVTVVPDNDSSDWGDYKRRYELAADTGDAPDIVVSGHEDVAVWGNVGYIIPFDDCRAAHPEYDDVIDELWDSAMWDGQLWGVPQDTEARPMFYNKTMLAELGWSDEEIDALPDQIRDGEFTLDDMIETAKEAIEAGVTEPGMGYWHRPTRGGDFMQYYIAHGGSMYDADEDKLVVDRDSVVEWYEFQHRVIDEGITPADLYGTDFEIWHETVSHGNVLFFNGGVWHWSIWLDQHVQDLGGEDYLFETFGYALQPTGRDDVPAQQLSHPLLYLISSPSASGNNYQDVACELLAKTTTAPINTLHAVESAHLGIVHAQSDYPDYLESEFLADTQYMTEHAFYQPNHVAYGQYFDALYDAMQLAAEGGLSPEDAADEAISIIQAEIPDDVIINE